MELLRGKFQRPNLPCFPHDLLLQRRQFFEMVLLPDNGAMVLTEHFSFPRQKL
jgi:hypothetical protein